MIGAILICYKIALQKIGEKEKLEHGKQDNELDQDYLPQGFPQGHRPKPLTVEMIYPHKSAAHQSQFLINYL